LRNVVNDPLSKDLTQAEQHSKSGCDGEAQSETGCCDTLLGGGLSTATLTTLTDNWIYNEILLDGGLSTSTLSYDCNVESDTYHSDLSLDYVRKTNYCDDSQSLPSFLHTEKDGVVKTITEYNADAILHDGIMTRVAGKRGRNRLMRGEIDDVKQTESDWLLSYHETIKPRDKMDLNYIVLNAEDYKKETNSHRLVFRVDDRETGDSYLWFKPCLNMLNNEYAEELEKTFKGLDSLLGLGITFTIKSNPYHSVKYDYDRLMSCFNKMTEKIRNLRWIVVYTTTPDGKRIVDKKATKNARDRERENIKKRLKSVGLNSDKIEWFRVSEIGKETFECHIHAIYYGIDYIPHDWLKDEWYKLTQDSYVVWVSRGKKKASSYARKYITKQIRSKETPQSLLLMWAMGSRVWGCSKGLLQRIKDSYNRLLCNKAGLDPSRFKVSILGLYLYDDYTGIYRITSDPPP